MQNFVTQLVREKMTSLDSPTEGGTDLKPPASIVRSNRILLKLNQGVALENVVIRAQNTHITLRLASMLMSEFEENGLFLSRDTYYDWQSLWETMLSPYECTYNPDVWCVIYINGVPVFKTSNAESAYMDYLEKYALAIDEEGFYDATFEDREKGRNQNSHYDLALRVDHSTQVAVHMETTNERLICRLFFRTSGKYRAFSFVLLGSPTMEAITHSLAVSAAYMEASNIKLVLGGSNPSDMQEEKWKDASQHLVLLEQEISDFEHAYASEYQTITF